MSPTAKILGQQDLHLHFERQIVVVVTPGLLFVVVAVIVVAVIVVVVAGLFDKSTACPFERTPNGSVL